MDMLAKAGLDPARDFSQLRLAGSHTSSLAALLSDQVDVAALSFDSFDKAVAQGAARPEDVRIIARSEPIPYPPCPSSKHLAQVWRGVNGERASSGVGF